MSKEWELIKNIYGCTTILMQETEAKETENAFKVVEKSLKALEIIKKKNVDIKLLKASSTVEQYNNELIRVLGRWFAEREFLTIEEFDTLKEVIG